MKRRKIFNKNDNSQTDITRVQYYVQIDKFNQNVLV